MRRAFGLIVVVIALLVTGSASANKTQPNPVICNNCEPGMSCTAANYQQWYYDGNNWWICWTNGLGGYFWLPA